MDHNLKNVSRLIHALTVEQQCLCSLQLNSCLMRAFRCQGIRLVRNGVDVII